MALLNICACNHQEEQYLLYTGRTQLKSILLPSMAVTEVYRWDMSGATMDHDIDSGTVQGVPDITKNWLGHAPIHSNNSPGAFH